MSEKSGLTKFGVLVGPLSDSVTLIDLSNSKVDLESLINEMGHYGVFATPVTEINYQFVGFILTKELSIDKSDKISVRDVDYFILRIRNCLRNSLHVIDKYKLEIKGDNPDQVEMASDSRMISKYMLKSAIANLNRIASDHGVK